MPPALSSRRIAALRRMRTADAVHRDFEPVADSLYETPQDLVESFAFFRDGTSVLVRDISRGRLRSEAAVLVLFSGLALTTFPLTPMLLPVIDKWRGDVTGLRRGDYVPVAFTRRKKLCAQSTPLMLPRVAAQRVPRSFRSTLVCHATTRRTPVVSSHKSGGECSKSSHLMQA